MKSGYRGEEGEVRSDAATFYLDVLLPDLPFYFAITSPPSYRLHHRIYHYAASRSPLGQDILFCAALNFLLCTKGK